MLLPSRVQFNNWLPIVGNRTTTSTYTGGNCSGTSGATDRVLTLSNTTLTNNEIIWLKRGYLHPNDYGIVHASSNTKITFSASNVYNDDEIAVRYHY